MKRRSIDDATPEEWNKATRNMKKKKKKKKKYKQKQADDAYSLKIRTRDDWTCQLRCHPECRGRVEPPTKLIQNSHFWNRTHHALRFDDLNCDTACDKCHMKWEDEKQGAYREWKIKQIGIEAYEELASRRHNYMGRRSDDFKKIIEESLKEVERIEEERNGTILGKH